VINMMAPYALLFTYVILSMCISSASSFGLEKSRQLFPRKLHLRVFKTEEEEGITSTHPRTTGSIKTEHEAAASIDPDPDISDNINSNRLEFIPIKLQNYLRDSGALRTIVDTLTRLVLAPAFYYENPHCFPELIRISEYPHWLATATISAMFDLFNVTDPQTGIVISSDDDDDDSSSSSRIHFKKEAYGPHPKQIAQVVVPEDLKGQRDLPLFMFLHGGAWGSGFPTMYRLISVPFLHKNYRTVILGYRTYPDGTIDEQVHDLVEAVQYFKQKYSSNGNGSIPTCSAPMVLIGHSSGAHVALMAALKGHLSSHVDALIGMSGVYDLELAREYELQQGLTELSPMGPVCGDALRENSPTWLASNGDEAILSSLPPVLLLHGENDTVAPPIYSRMLHQVLINNEKNDKGPKCHLEVLEGLQHQDTLLETCLGRGKTQAVIFQWLDSILK